VAFRRRRKNLTNYANGSVAASGGAPAFNTNAGAFTGTLSGAPGFDASPFTTYCVQLSQTFGWGNLLNYTVQGGSSYFNSQVPALPSSGATVVDRLGKLFTWLGGVSVPATATESQRSTRGVGVHLQCQHAGRRRSLRSTSAV
jgi:hypothetical protein